MPAEFVHKTQGIHHFAVQFSPFYVTRLAIAGSKNYGLVGNGNLCIVATDKGESDINFVTQTGIFDLCWSEKHENLVYVACADGTIQLYDITLQEFPVKKWYEHKRECFSVNANLLNTQTIVSSSWDGTIKLWDAEHKQSLMTLQAELPNCIYKADFSPYSGYVVSSVSSDGILRLWDTRLGKDVSMRIDAAHHGKEILSSDWSKYDQTIIFSSGVDCEIKKWDIRMPYRASCTMIGHKYPARNIKSSNHRNNMLASCGYDMTPKIWILNSTAEIISPVISYNEHSEFVFGLDWCLWGDGSLIATASWDQTVQIWRIF